MKLYPAIIVLAVGLGVILLSSSPGNTDYYQFKVEVQTPQGVKTGKVIRAVTYTPKSTWFPFGESRPSWRVRGEAVAVDLPGGRTLYGLLTGQALEETYAERIFDYASEGSDGLFGQASSIELYPSPPKTDRLARFSALPMMVTFANELDPASVQLVKPDNLAERFGPGYRLKRVTVSKASGPVTETILERLPWLPRVGHQPSLRKVRIDGTYSRDPIDAVSASDFKTGLFD